VLDCSVRPRSKPAPCWRGAGRWRAGERQTITTYLWLTGATTVKHFSRFYVFLGGALYQVRWTLWGRIIRYAAQWVPETDVIVLIVDDSTKKKAGRHIEGVGHYRNGAGSARQEYRHAARAQLCVGDYASATFVLARAEGQCSDRFCPSTSKRNKLSGSTCPINPAAPWPREIIDFVATQLPSATHFVWLSDGGYATKDYLHQLPTTVHVVGRMLITGKLYAPPPRGPRRGCPPKKGVVVGVSEDVCPQMEWLAPPSYRKSGRSSKRGTGPLAYRLAGTLAPRRGHPAPDAARRPKARGLASRLPQWKRCLLPSSR